MLAPNALRGLNLPAQRMRVMSKSGDPAGRFGALPFDEKWPVFRGATRDLSVNTNGYMTNAPNDNIPAAILSLFYAGVAGFHADRNTSRGDVLRGSRFFAQRAACVRVQTASGDHGSQSELSGLTKVSVGQRFRSLKINVGVTPFHYIADAMKVGAAECLTKRFDDDMLLSSIHDAIDRSDFARQEVEMRLLRSDQASGARGHGFGGHRLAKSSAHPVGVAAWIKPDAGCPGQQSMKHL